MTFWDIDQEINLVSNKPQDKKVHATEARSAFGSTDFAINLNSTGTSSNNSSGNNSARATSSSSDGFTPSSLTTSPTSLPNRGTKASGSVFTPNHDNPNTPKNVAHQLRTAGLPNGSSIDDRYQAFESHQRSVPPLPVPELKETLELYLKSLEGLVTAESWQRTKENVDAFMTDKLHPGDAESVGEKLQKLLKEHADAAKPNWLESFWDDMYLFGRDALPINVNYCFGFSPSPFQLSTSSTSSSSSSSSLEAEQKQEKEQKAKRNSENDDDDDQQQQGNETQLNRAACILHAMGSIYNEIRLGKWSLDYERKSPQCMSQYRRVFCASRIPGEHRDSIETYLAPGHIDLTSDELASNTCSYVPVAEPIRHVIVIIRNRYFAVDIFDKKDDEVGFIRLSSIEEIGKRLAKVLHAAIKEGATAGAPVGVLTTTHRTDWWRAREELKELGNEPILTKIQSAIVVVALDALPTTDSQERARIFLHGPGTNRWFDRHTIIITRNGDAGINFEHAVGDGATTLRVVDETYRREKHYHTSHTKPHLQVLSKARVRELMKEAAVASAISTDLENSEESVIELRWKLDGHVDFLMRGAYNHYVELIQSTETTTLEFARFGGDYIKKSGNSPDAFVQLAFQLTYHRLFGRPTATYEAASTRTYSHGRTEVLRACTRAATDFCQMSGEPIFSHRVNSQIPPQLALLRSATEAHVNYMKRAKEGRGVDRHLLGLRMMAAKSGIETPAIFADENFKLSSHWALSTSHCGSSALTLFGFGPVVPDGFGLGYMIKNDNISFVITSKYTHRYHSSTVFSTMLESSLLQMRAIVDADWESREMSRPKAMTFSHPTTYNDIEFDPTRGFKYAHKQKRSLYASSSTGGFNNNNSSMTSPNGSFQPEASY